MKEDQYNDLLKQLTTLQETSKNIHMQTKELKESIQSIYTSEQNPLPKELKKAEKETKTYNIPNYQDLAWPLALDPRLIPRNAASEIQRAFQIAEKINQNTSEARILDFGCGKGYLAKEYSKRSPYVIGYDILEAETWKNTETLHFTTDPQEITKSGPYNLIIIYDVLDHINAAYDPARTLLGLKEMLTNNGMIYLETHPWTSRHGAHQYELEPEFNKAYLHLLLTPEEAGSIDFDHTYTLPILRPMQVYHEWFKQAGLKVQSRTINSSEESLSYFSDELIDRIIQVTWNDEIDRSTAKKIMANESITYVLKR